MDRGEKPSPGPAPAARVWFYFEWAQRDRAFATRQAKREGPAIARALKAALDAQAELREAHAAERHARVGEGEDRHDDEQHRPLQPRHEGVQRAAAAPGADFAALSKEHDHGVAGQQGGEGIGQKRGEIRPAELEEAVWSLPPGRSAG